MDKERLKRLLAEIQDEMKNSPRLDEREKARLREIDHDIRKKLEQADEYPAHSDTVSQLQESIDQLEVTHPSLTMMLSELMEILSNAGI